LRDMGIYVNLRILPNIMIHLNGDSLVPSLIAIIAIFFMPADFFRDLRLLLLEFGMTRFLILCSIIRMEYAFIPWFNETRNGIDQDGTHCKYSNG